MPFPMKPHIKFGLERYMKTTSLIAMGTACLLGMASPSYAQQGPNGPGGPGGPGGGGPQGQQHGPQQGPRGGGHGRPMRNAPPSRGGYDNVDMNRVWHRGDRYDGPRNSRWVVNNWQSYRGLSAPPPGYQWMRYGNQYLLTAVATGVIAGVVSATIASPMMR